MIKKQIIMPWKETTTMEKKLNLPAGLPAIGGQAGLSVNCIFNHQ